MKRKTLLFIFIVFHVFYSFSQGQTNIWYFGDNAGLDFSSGNPVAITNGQLVTNEGCASISNADGDLLFYTDGSTVWDRNHTIMANGTGLQGNSTSSQSGIIVPFVNDTTKYYIFCVDHNTNNGGLYYSVLDLTLNGGNGDIIPDQKNILLLSTSAEKIAAISDENEGYWLVSYATPTGNFGGLYNTFHSFHITSTGIDLNTVRSTYNGCATDDGRGYLKISPDGTKIAICNQNQLHTCLHNFDSTSGRVGPEIEQLITQNAPYCAEFSPNSEKMYVSSGQFVITTTYLHQFDITAPDVNATRVELHSAVERRAGMQLAIDGKIYYARPGENFLGVINNPEADGLACNYVNEAVNLGTGVSQQGLPPFIQSLFIVSIDFENTCIGDATRFSVSTNTEDITSILWDFGDGNTSMIENPAHMYEFTGTYEVTVTVNTASLTQTNTKTVVISNPPIASPITNYLICDDSTNDGFTPFDLSTKDVEALTGQDVGDTYTVTYYTSMEDAENGQNALPETYTNVSNPEEIFAKITPANNSECFAITSFNLIVYESPIDNTVTDINVCDDLNDSQELINLSELTDQVLGTQSSSIFDVFYYETITDANNDTNRLPATYTLQNASQIIYIRKQNRENTECFILINFTLSMQTQYFANPVNDMIVCDDISNDNAEEFNLGMQDQFIANGQTGAFSITYYTSQEDAENSQNVLPTNYTNTTNPETIFAKIEHNDNSECFSITSFDLIVSESPTADMIMDISVCDDFNDSQELINLSLLTDQVLGTQSSTVFDVFYYEDIADANSDTNRLPTSYVLQNATQTIYARKQNRENTTCFTIVNFTLLMRTQYIANPVSDLIICDDLSNDGTEVFNLGNQNEFIANGQTGAFSITYHTSQAAADTNTDAIATNFSNETNPQEIFVRIENDIEANCYDTTSFFIEVKEVPNVNTDEMIVYVCSNESITISADAGYDEYAWNTGQTTQEITITEAGLYTATVITNYASSPAVSCSNTQTIRVIASDEAIITNVEIQDWTFNNNQFEVFIEGIGDYEFSIDAVNYQDSPIFSNLLAGSFTVYVRDKNGCGVVSEEVNLLFYPSFFTPNNDGYNDYWQIISSEFEPDLRIHIFDRYGKLLTILKPESRGWNGTFHGRQLPSSDYWFMIERPSNNQRYTGHFTLKR